MQFNGQPKKDYFNRMNFQETTTIVNNPELQKIKDKLRNNLFEKRNLQSNIRTLSDSLDPIR